MFPALANGGLVPVEFDGYVVCVPQAALTDYLHRDHEPLTAEAFEAALASGATVVDVGAHIGYFALLAASRIGPTGTVHAFEPVEASADALEQGIRVNGFENVIVHRIAAAESPSTRQFLVGDRTQESSFYPSVLSGNVASVSIDAKPVDDVVSGRADVIMVDAEGAEIEILRGMSELLGKSSGAVVFAEWCPGFLRAAGIDPFEVIDTMQELGIREIVGIDDNYDRRNLDLSELRQRVYADPLWHVNLRGVVGQLPPATHARRAHERKRRHHTNRSLRAWEALGRT